MAKQNKQPKSTLKVKLGACLTQPNRRFLKDLEEAGRLMNIARNAAMRAWLVGRLSNPDWVPGQATDRDGNKRFTTPKKKGEKPKPALEPPHCPSDVGRAMYAAACAASKPLAASLASSAAQEVHDWLTARMPRNQSWQSLYRWQAVLAAEISIPTFREIDIPVPARAPSYLGYMAHVASGNGVTCADPETEYGDSRQDMMLSLSLDSAVVGFPLMGLESGRKHRFPICRLELGSMTPGHKRLIESIARGEIKFRDSTISTDGKDWFLGLVYDPEISNVKLSKRRVAHLWPAHHEANKPFVITGPTEKRPDGSRSEPRWNVGKGYDYLVKIRRLSARRQELATRYKTKVNGRRGRGIKAYFEQRKPYAKAGNHYQSDFLWQMVAEVVRFCKRFDCGKVVYHEPGMGLRKIDKGESAQWFPSRGESLNYTALLNRLKHKLYREGIVLEVVRCNATDFRERWKPKAA